MSQSIADFRIRSMMCAPLIDSEGKAFGALQIDTLDQRQRFTKDDLELLASTASQAAIAINNAQLHEAALKQARVRARHGSWPARCSTAFCPNSSPTLAGYDVLRLLPAAGRSAATTSTTFHCPMAGVAIVVADVVGHGVAAALLMAKLSAETRFCPAQRSRLPAQP